MYEHLQYMLSFTVYIISLLCELIQKTTPTHTAPIGIYNGERGNLCSTVLYIRPMPYLAWLSWRKDPWSWRFYRHKRNRGLSCLL